MAEALTRAATLLSTALLLVTATTWLHACRHAERAAPPVHDLVVIQESETGFRLGGRIWPLTHVSQVAVVGDRWIVVAQPMERHLKVLEVGGGRLVEVLGQAGDGPAEFREIDRIGVTLDGHAVWVSDPANRRITTFAAGDWTVHSVPVPTTGGDAGPLRPIGWWPEGSIVALETAFMSDRVAEAGISILSVGGSGEQRRLGEPISIGNSILKVTVGTGPGRREATRIQPIVADPVVAPGPASGSALVVGSGASGGASGRIEYRIGSGACQWSYGRTLHPIPRGYRDSITIELAGHLVASGILEDHRRARTLVGEQLFAGPHWPVAQGILPSMDGYLWLEVGIDEDGRRLHERIGVRSGALATTTYATPSHVRILWTGADRSIGVATDDETGLQRIVWLGPSPAGEYPASDHLPLFPRGTSVREACARAGGTMVNR